MTNKRINAYLICGGDFHDMDFARLELLKVMAENPNIRVKVGSDYSDIKAILDADFLVTYTCNVIPDAAQSQAIKVWLSSGKKWYALHGTNSICQFLSFDPVCVSTPRDAPELMDMLGSQFLAHPPTCDYRVHVTDPNHELVIGIEDFDTYDELYLSEFYGNHHCLLHTHFNGVVADFEEGQQWSDDNIRPVMYLNPYGDGEVLYLTLGHCRSTYDMQPLMEEYPQTDRCSWELDIFYELLRRGIAWCIK